MTICWVGTAGSFNMFIVFIKYLPGNAFLSGTAMGFSCFGYMACDLLLKRSKVLTIMSASYLFSFIILGVILLCDNENTSHIIFALLFFVLKFLICMGYSCVFLAHIDLFPPQILSTSYGICGILYKCINMYVPILAETDNKIIPLLAILILNLLAFISAVALRKF